MVIKKLQVIRDGSSGTRSLPPCIATIGNFDGLHLGHQSIIKHLIRQSQTLGLVPSLISFEPAPQKVLRPAEPYIRVMSLQQKIQLLEKWGIAQFFCIRFDKKLAGYSPGSFVENILLKKCQVKHVLVGEDFRFGQEKKGDVQTLKCLGEAYHFQVEILSLLEEQDHKMSSTRIRQFLLKGDMVAVHKALGRHFSVIARVVSGAGRGHHLGFPTANLAAKTLSPLLSGVFVVIARVAEKHYHAIANVGWRPTVDGNQHVVEVHILDFSGNLYGIKMEVYFLHKLRDEKRFASSQQLIEQIRNDIVETRKFFSIDILEVESS